MVSVHPSMVMLTSSVGGRTRKERVTMGVMRGCDWSRANGMVCFYIGCDVIRTDWMGVSSRMVGGCG